MTMDDDMIYLSIHVRNIYNHMMDGQPNKAMCFFFEFETLAFDICN